MKITTVGLLVELDKIPFKVGAILPCTFSVDDGRIFHTEKIRSIKHYDKFYRTKPVKKKKTLLPDGTEAPEEPVPPPKRLVEFHFQKALETTRVAITKFLLKERSGAKA